MKVAAKKKTATKTARKKSSTTKKKKVSLSLLDVIVKSISDKKGENITSIDLTKIPDTATSHFVICDASSGTQVKAIADSVVEQSRITLNERPWHVEGIQQLDWVLIDFVNVVVHVFRRQAREFYQLEDLWNDGIVTRHDD
ncbi:MAG TPA: ribosome silencing factor [Bacteroidetes bacterium]|nr:ribosome silencing factor [Bacteroidota bacterium]